MLFNSPRRLLLAGRCPDGGCVVVSLRRLFLEGLCLERCGFRLASWRLLLAGL